MFLSIYSTRILKRKREDADVTASLSERVNSLTIKNQRLSTEVESLPIEVFEAREKWSTLNLAHAEREQTLLQQKVEGLLRLVQVKQKRISYLETTRHSWIESLGFLQLWMRNIIKQALYFYVCHVQCAWFDSNRWDSHSLRLLPCDLGSHNIDGEFWKMMILSLFSSLFTFSENACTSSSFVPTVDTYLQPSSFL